MSSSAAPPPVIDDAAVNPTSDSAAALAAPDADVDDAAATDPGRRSAGEQVQLDSAAIDLAKAAAVAEAGIADHVGEFVSAVAEDDIGVTASFAARQIGYAGWHWSVTLALLDQAPATVSEVVLLPGEGSLLAPAWVPWDQRIRPGDVGVGDLLPPIENDPRLVPTYIQSDDEAVEAVARELGIGRVHVLSREGRVDFAERLHDGTFGPAGEIALAAPANCFTCAFYLPLAGSLGQLVGACSNEYSPADGRVVDAGFGCGAHSETVIEMPARSATTLAVIDELSLEVFRRPRPTAVSDVEAGSELAAVDVADEAVQETELLAAETGDAEIADVEIAEPEVVDADETEPEVAESESVDAEITDLEITDLEIPDLEAAEPEIVEAEIVDAEVIQPEVVEVEAADDGPTSEADGDSTTGD